MKYGPSKQSNCNHKRLNILSDCQISDVINSLLNVFRLNRKFKHALFKMETLCKSENIDISKIENVITLDAYSSFKLNT